MPILQVAIPKPLSNYFDYLPPVGIDINQLTPGIRLQVPFGNLNYIGMLVNITNTSQYPINKLRPAIRVIDLTPILSADDLELLKWAANYYHYYIGEVITTALPSALNQGLPAIIKPLIGWKLTQNDIQLANLPKNAIKQKSILNLLQQHPQGLTQTYINSCLSNTNSSLKVLQQKGLITKELINIIPNKKITKSSHLQLNQAQTRAVNQVCTNLHQFYPVLLDGVTGSGKTEVYLQIIQEVLNKGKQALILVPEINLTPQTVNRFEQRFAIPIATWHSKLTKSERLHTWLLAKNGTASIIIGTRSAIWIPLANPGIFIVDEEHDLSYKQQNNFRYSARDIAVVRSKRAQVPVLLGSATPSLDSLFNAGCQRYLHFKLPERAGTAIHPTYHIVDMRHQPPRESLSRPLVRAIKQRLAAKQQILLFINRRGYASTLTCYKCGWVAFCQHCDARLAYHETSKNLQCHHCGVMRPLYVQCPECKHTKLYLLGQGTERIEEYLRIQFSNSNILRIDSDSVSHKNAMEKVLEQIHTGEVDILIGTQMLAKGHHFPKVTLVGIINIDSGLYGSDFRSSERMAQLLIQVSGRAGRANEPGEVIIQTYHPEHPLLDKLIHQGYPAFSQEALKERYKAAFPPYTYLALLRAESTDKPPLEFLERAKKSAQQCENVQLWGPIVSPMEKRADWYRAQLLLQALQRKHLHNFINQWLPTLPASNKKKVRWSLDIDPQDLF